MTYGVDLYARYQRLNDTSAFQASPYDWAYVKGTDGGGLAAYPADQVVNQLKDASIPVGLYGYAQLSPSPEAQADVLTRTVQRLGATGLPPALDLEDPHIGGQASRDFAHRYLTRLRENGFSHVVLYANTTMLRSIRAWDLPVPGLLIWAASYGTNDAAYTDADRQRLASAYPHPVWIHQYSSVGGVPGITTPGGQPTNVDKNKMLHPIGEDDMPLDNNDVSLLRDGMAIQVFTQDGQYAKNPDGSLYKVSLGEILGRNNQAGWGSVIEVRKLAAAFAEFSAKTEGVLAGLLTAVQQLADDEELDVAAIEAAAERGAQKGVESATVDVDVNIAGHAQFDTPTE